jgi:hypothetical protein
LGFDKDSLSVAPAVGAPMQRQRLTFELECVSFSLVRDDGLPLFDASANQTSISIVNVSDGFQLEFGINVIRTRC